MLPLLVSLSLLSSAEAADLSRAGRGTPYGLASVLAEPPSEGCVKAPEEAVAWSCPQEVGGVPILVHYIVNDGYYVGVTVECDGFSACQVLHGAVSAAWDVPYTLEHASDRAPLADGFWNLLGSQRGETTGCWTYSPYRSKGMLTLVQMGLRRLVEAKRAAAALKAAEDL